MRGPGAGANPNQIKTPNNGFLNNAIKTGTAAIKPTAMYQSPRTIKYPDITPRKIPSSTRIQNVEMMGRPLNSRVPTELMLIIIGFFFYLGVPPNTAYLTEVSPRENRGLAFGLLFSVGALPGAFSPIIFGWIGDLWGLRASVLFLVVTTILATVVALFMKDQGSEESASEPYAEFTTHTS